MSEASKTWGYCRVSSREQNLDRQLVALQQHVPMENIVIDKRSGKDFEREGYQALKGPLGLKPGDTLYIKSLDRLSRNKDDIKKELEWFRENDIRLMIIDLPTSMIQVPDGQSWIIDMINNILIEVMGTMAEQERNNIKTRQQQGIENARDKGIKMGRPKLERPENWAEVTAEWTAKKITAVEAMKRTGLKKNTFYSLALEDGLYEPKK